MPRQPPDHSYEEIRNVVLEIILGRSGCPGDPPSEFLDLQDVTARCFIYRETDVTHFNQIMPSSLSRSDQDTFREIFWDLFREGIITLGTSKGQPEFPWFTVTKRGWAIAEHQRPYWFHDVITYESAVLQEIPDIDLATLAYLRESMQAYLSGCVLSATVMLGVATESSFERLLETIKENEDERSRFKKCLSERGIYRRLNAFGKAIQDHSKLPRNLAEGLDIQITSTVNLIRQFRNDSGHPTGKTISRQQCYTLLHLFIPCCKKIYELIDHFQVELEDEPA